MYIKRLLFSFSQFFNLNFSGASSFQVELRRNDWYRHVYTASAESVAF